MHIADKMAPYFPELRFELAIVPLERHDPGVAGRGKIPQAQINSDRPLELSGRRPPCLSDRDRYVQIPLAAWILTDVSGTEVILQEAIAVPQRKCLPAKNTCPLRWRIALALNGIYARERRAPPHTRRRSFILHSCWRRVTYSSPMAWMVWEYSEVLPCRRLS